MKKILFVTMCLFWSASLFADLVDDGNVEYNKNNYKKALELYTQACYNGVSKGHI